MKQLSASIVAMLTLSLPLLCDSDDIDRLIDTLQTTPVEKRYILINRLKTKLIKLKERDRVEALKKLKSLQNPSKKVNEANRTASTSIKEKNSTHQVEDIMEIEHIEIHRELNGGGDE